MKLINVHREVGWRGNERCFFLLHFLAGVRTIEYWGATREGISYLKVSNYHLPVLFILFCIWQII